MDALREYVVGFAFSHDLKRVLLIRKTHPAWQKDKLNGTGGRVEKNESQWEAMRREHREETGRDIDCDKWNCFAVIDGNNIHYEGEIERDPQAEFFKVWFYWTKDEIHKAKSQTEEPLKTVSLIHLPWINGELVSAVNWLLPMAASMASSRATVYSIQERYHGR